MRLGTVILAAVAGFSVSLAAQTQTIPANNNNGAAAAQPTQAAPPQVMYGGTLGNNKPQVVPVTGETKIHGSTVPRSMMPREESLGDAARRLKKKKYGKYHKQKKAHKAKKQPPYLR